MKSLNLKEKLTCLLLILSVVIFVQTGADSSTFPSVSAEGDVCPSRTSDWEEDGGIYAPDHAVEQQVARYSVTPCRIFFHRGNSLPRKDLVSGYWNFELHMPQSVCVMMSGGGIFLLFYFLASLPGQFYSKLNITHKSDGKKRPLQNLCVWNVYAVDREKNDTYGRI